MTAILAATGFDAAELQALRDRLAGDAFIPGDVGYDAGRLAWNLSFDHRPAVVVLPHGTADVVAAVRFARETGLGIAVQATGHGVAATADGALLLVTSRMTDVRVDPGARTARIAAGAKWEPVLAQAQAVGLAPLLGSSSDVGAVGYTLGGGMGWLARKHGLSVDKVRSFEVVTTDGRVLRVSPTEEPELFWGLRGGGAGSLAIVTEMEVGLVPVTTVYGGNLLYPAELATEVMARWRAWIADVPDELTSSVALMNFPPFEQVPEPLRGRSFVIVRGCWSGSIEEGEELLRPWREWREPVHDLFGPMAFADAATISNDPVDPEPAHSTSEWLAELTDDAIAALARYALPDGGPPVLAFAEVRHAGGAMARIDPATAAYGTRDGALVLQCVGITPTPEARSAVAAQLHDLRAALQGCATGAPYLNFLEGEEKRDRTRHAFPPATFLRLQALKAAYDPDGLLRFGVAIDPAARN